MLSNNNKIYRHKFITENRNEACNIVSVIIPSLNRLMNSDSAASQLVKIPSTSLGFFFARAIFSYRQKQIMIQTIIMGKRFVAFKMEFESVKNDRFHFLLRNESLTSSEHIMKR